ncbi:FecR family protein [Phocaeicola sp.]
MNSPKSDKELDEWLEQLASSTHSPQGKFSAEESYSILQQRLIPARRKRKVLSIRYVTAVAAGLVLLIGFGWMFYSYQRPARMLTVLTNAETQRIELPDGSEVTLNRHSQLSYPETFGKERIVNLNGEAYFEVSKNPEKPFRVKTNGVTVSVLGTHFNVNAYATDSLVETTLLEGSVAVSDNKNGNQVILKPNETAVYRKATGMLTMHSDSDADNEISWRDGILSFDNATMGEIARQLSHHFNVTIQIEGERLRNYKLNASFKQDETLEEILEMLAPIGDFTYKTISSNVIELKQEN